MAAAFQSLSAVKAGSKLILLYGFAGVQDFRAVKAGSKLFLLYGFAGF